jgi:hypothetical protein
MKFAVFTAAASGQTTADRESSAAHFVEDATILPPNHGPVTGRVDEITILSPGVAAYRSTLTGKRVPKDGGHNTASPAIPR